MRTWILLLAGICAAANGQDVYPNRAVHVTVPFTPGTGADILARVLGPRLAERWKSAVVVENRVGATGNIGTEYVAKATPDGYTLLFTATSFGTNPALVRTLPFDPVKSFAPVILAATSSVAVIVNPQVPAKSLHEFIDLVHVPYKGAGGAITDLIGGHVQAMISALQTVAPHVQSGKLRMLAVMSGERSPAFPEVPTAKEQGLPELEVETWYGLFAPAGTPMEVVMRLNRDVNFQLQNAEIRELLSRQGMTAAGGTPERFGGL